MGPGWDFNEAFGSCCGYPIEGYQQQVRPRFAGNRRRDGKRHTHALTLRRARSQGASNGSSGGSAISAEGWRFNICDEPGRCVADPVDGISLWWRAAWARVSASAVLLLRSLRRRSRPGLSARAGRLPRRSRPSGPRSRSGGRRCEPPREGRSRTPSSKLASRTTSRAWPSPRRATTCAHSACGCCVRLVVRSRCGTHGAVDPPGACCAQAVERAAAGADARGRRAGVRRGRARSGGLDGAPRGVDGPSAHRRPHGGLRSGSGRAAAFGLRCRARGRVSRGRCLRRHRRAARRCAARHRRGPRRWRRARRFLVVAARRRSLSPCTPLDCNTYDCANEPASCTTTKRGSKLLRAASRTCAWWATTLRTWPAAAAPGALRPPPPRRPPRSRQAPVAPVAGATCWPSRA